jgi:hypothetical protein
LEKWNEEDLNSFVIIIKANNFGCNKDDDYEKTNEKNSNENRIIYDILWYVEMYVCFQKW